MVFEFQQQMADLGCIGVHGNFYGHRRQACDPWVSKLGSVNNRHFVINRDPGTRDPSLFVHRKKRVEFNH
jgi:hypothetical protein